MNTTKEMQLYGIRNLKPTDVTASILFIYRQVSTCFGSTDPSSGDITLLFTQPLVQFPYRFGRVLCNVVACLSDCFLLNYIG
jgi:hypothetical protein